MILLLAPEKLIVSTSREIWLEAFTGPVSLFTSAGTKSYRSWLSTWQPKPFKQVEFFSDYATNDLIELQAIKLHQQQPITKIIPMAEADILRAAHLRERLNIPGQTVANATLFRDKVKMKQQAQKAGIAMPRFTVISNTLDLLDFIAEVHYPVVIKPILGRGSLNTFLIKDPHDLANKLAQGFISNTGRYTDLLAEEYIDGQIYHIDGLQLRQSIHTLSVSKYVNNCLDFVNGSYLGSYTLADHNPLKVKILNFCQDVLTQAFILPENALIHMEVFVDRQENIKLCEIACRIGGNGINDEVALRHGIDIKMSYIRAESGLPERFSDRAHDGLAARLLIPPKEGRLLSIPHACEDEQVIRYQARGEAGKFYQKMQMSNDEIANFLLTGKNETEVQQKIQELAAWFYHHTQWQTHF